MKFYIDKNQDKYRPYFDALLDAGYEEVENYREADIYITDHNWNDGFRQGKDRLAECKTRGIPTFMIPHGFRSPLFWDAVYDVSHDIDCFFVPAKGHKQVLEVGGFPVRMVVTGYPWTKIYPFEHRNKPQKILFAPIHPDWFGSYTYSHYAYAWNKRVWQKLAALKNCDIVVYYNGDVQRNGLTVKRDVMYIPSRLTTEAAVEMIHMADVVVAHDTFASLAIAHGKPTVMFDDYFHDHRAGPPSKYFAHYQKYTVYPYNMISPESAMGILDASTRPTDPFFQWRELFIGWNFSPSVFIRTIEEYL